MSEFPQFANLLLELQLLIWEFALQEPRVIHITNIDTESLRITEPYEPERSRHLPPGLLLACRTSHRVLQHHYRKLRQGLSSKHAIPLGFDPQLDTLYLDVSWHFYFHQVPANMSLLAPKNILSSIRYLAVASTPWYMVCVHHISEMMVRFFANFPALEKVTLALEAPCLCNVYRQEEVVKYPLQLERIRRESRCWLFKRKLMCKVVLLAEDKARQKNPDVKFPKFDVKRLERLHA